MNLTAIYDAMELGSLAILLKITGDNEKAGAVFIKARQAADQLGPFSLTGQALRVALEDAENADAEVPL